MSGLNEEELLETVQRLDKALQHACEIGFDDGCPIELFGENPWAPNSSNECSKEFCNNTPCWQCWRQYFLTD